MKNAFRLTVTAAIVFLLVGAAIAGERGRRQSAAAVQWAHLGSNQDLSRVKRALSR